MEYNLTFRWPDDKSAEEHQHFKSLLREIAEWQRYHVGKVFFVWVRRLMVGLTATYSSTFPTTKHLAFVSGA